MKRIIILLLHIAIFHIYAISSFSQFEVIKITDYVSGFFSNPFLLDTKGNIWYYNKAICKSEGNEIHSFNEVLSGPISRIFEDTNGNIWFSSQKNGMFKYNGTDLKHVEELKLAKIPMIFEDRHKNLWFNSQKDGLYKYDGIGIYLVKELESEVLAKIFEDSDGNIWFGTNTGVLKYDNKNWISYGKEDGVNKMVYDINEDSKGNVWLRHYYNGITKYDGKTFTHYSKKDGIDSDIFNQMFLDKNGNILVRCPNKSIIKFSNDKWSKLTDYHFPGGTIAVASDSVIWFGVSKQYNFSPGIVGTATTTFAKVWNDWFLLNYSNDSLHVFTKKNTGLHGIPDEINTTIIFEDSKGIIWVALNPGLIRFDGVKWEYIDKVGDVRLENIRAIIEDKNNNIWVAFSGHKGAIGFNTCDGIAKYDGIAFSIKELGDSGIVHNMAMSPDGRIWILECSGIYVIDTIE